MCYNLGASTAATTAPAPEPEPEPPGPSASPAPPPLPRLPGWPRARSARSPPPPRARPVLDAVSAAARLPPAPLRSPSQAEPSPAGSGRGGQGARGRRSVWSQRAGGGRGGGRRGSRRRRRRAPGTWARALRSPETVPPAPGPHPAQVGRGLWERGLRGGCGGGGLLCGSCGASGARPWGRRGRCSPRRQWGRARGPQRFPEPRPPQPLRPARSVRAGAEFPRRWSFGCGALGPRFLGVPRLTRVPRRAHPKLAVAEPRPDKLPSPTPRPDGPGLRTPRARRRRGDPETLLSAVRAKGGLGRERGGGLACECAVGAAAPQVGPETAPLKLEPHPVVEGGQGVDSGCLAFAQPALGSSTPPRAARAFGGGVPGPPIPPVRSPGSARRC